MAHGGEEPQEQRAQGQSWNESSGNMGKEQISLFQQKYNNLKRQNYKGKREVLAARGRGEDQSAGSVQLGV